MVNIDLFSKDDQTPVWRAKLTAGNLSAEILSFGAITKSMRLNGDDLVLGYDNLAAYLADTHFVGIIAGRVGNRIANGRFDLDGQTYTLDTNDGPHHLHGGASGFGKCHWDIEPDTQRNAIMLRSSSEHMAGGYPGILDIEILISLNEGGISYEMQAVPSEATPINLAQHSYYNLGTNALHHRLKLAAGQYTPTDPLMIPTGEIRPVEGPTNFVSERRIGDGLPPSQGLDHNFVLQETGGPQAVLSGPLATLTVKTDQPALQVYTGQHLTKPFRAFQGVCLEPQAFPNSVNEPEFPSCIHSPDKPYSQQTQIEIIEKRS